MAKPWIRRIRRLAVAVVVVAAFVLPVVLVVTLPAVTSALARVIPALFRPLVIVIAVEATLVLLVAIWWLWWRLPQRQVRRLASEIPDAKARADVEDNFRKTVGQALGGAAVLIGAGVAYLQFTQQQQASHDLLISNQVSKSFEQLGSKEIATRLGGIYGLEGVMNTSLEYHQPVLEALCAFVRDSTTGKVSDKPATDVQAALTVIGRRKQGSGDVELAGASIPGADLFDADLGGANVRGANLVHAALGLANLNGANLSGANLSDADLTDAKLKADLSSANLSGASLIYASLSGAALSDANLSGADLSNANLSGADLIDANLSRADLNSANLNGASLSGANLSGANLNGARLGGAFMGGANLSDANLIDANLGDARYLVQEQLNSACGKPKALPPGLTLDKPCPPRPAPPKPSPGTTP